MLEPLLPLLTLPPPLLPAPGVQARLDRVFAKVRDWEGAHIELVGDRPIEGLTREVRPRGQGSTKEIPVWISDLGLFAVFKRSSKQQQQAQQQQQRRPGAA